VIKPPPAEGNYGIARRIGGDELMRSGFAPVTLGKTEFSRVVGDFTLTDTTYAGGTRLPRHAHARPALSLVLEGSFTQTYDARAARECGTLDLLFEPAEAVHRNTFPASGGRILILEVDDGGLRTFGGVAESFAAPRVVSGGPLRAAALRLYGESRGTDAAAQLLLEGLALELLALAARERLRPPGPVAPRWLRSVRDRLDAEFRQGVSLSLIADEAGVHPVYLSRAFRKFYGCSPGEYARRLQVELAARLLRETDTPPSRVALDAGFADQSHLTRVFKLHTGQTPARFRRATRRAGSR
jgi:AraC family transcriptional regulator